MSLPTIHPLRGDKATRWADEAQTKCGCDFCLHWYPLIQHLEAQLDERGRKLLNQLVENWMHQSDDFGVANAKLEGNWPGWEWLPAEIAKRQKTT